MTYQEDEQIEKERQKVRYAFDKRAVTTGGFISSTHFIWVQLFNVQRPENWD